MAYYASSPPNPLEALSNPTEYMRHLTDWNQWLKEAKTLAPQIAKIPGIYVIPGVAGSVLREATNYYHLYSDTKEEANKVVTTASNTWTGTITTATTTVSDLASISKDISQGIPLAIAGGVLLIALSKK